MSDFYDKIEAQNPEMLAIVEAEMARQGVIDSQVGCIPCTITI